MNGTCFQDPIGFIKFSISPEFVPLLMDKDLLHKIFVSLLGIKQELYAKSFQVNDIRETYLPTLKTHVVNLKRDTKDLSRDLQQLEVRGKLRSTTLYWNVKKSSFITDVSVSLLCRFCQQILSLSFSRGSRVQCRGSRVEGTGEGTFFFSFFFLKNKDVLLSLN